VVRIPTRSGGNRSGLLAVPARRRLLAACAIIALALAVACIFGCSCLNKIRFRLWPSTEFEHYAACLRKSGTEWGRNPSEEDAGGSDPLDASYRARLLCMNPHFTAPLFLERLADPNENIKVREVACEGLCTYEMWKLEDGPELRKQRFIRSFFLVLWRVFTGNQEPARLRRGVDSKLRDLALRRRAVLAGDPSTGRATWLRALCDTSRPTQHRVVALSILDALRQDVVEECMALLRAGETPPSLRAELYGYLRHFSGRHGFGLPKEFEDAWWKNDRNTQEAWWTDGRNVEHASQIIQEWFETHQDAVRAWVRGENTE